MQENPVFPKASGHKFVKYAVKTIPVEVISFSFLHIT
jgi:hypothetical protein